MRLYFVGWWWAECWYSSCCKYIKINKNVCFIFCKMWVKLILYIFLLIFILFWSVNAFFNWIIKFSSAKIQSRCCGWISPPTNPLLWLHSNGFLFPFKLDKPTTHLHIMTAQAWLNTWLSFAVAPISSSHTVTGSGTSPGSSGTVCWPMSSRTDCGPHRVGSANMLHTRTVCFLSSMTSCERRCQSCCGHGMSPFHWHLPQKRGDMLQVSLPYPLFFWRRGHNLPTPPNGRATIRLCRTQSLEQKLPLEVSLMSLEMTCQKGQNLIRKHIPPKSCFLGYFVYIYFVFWVPWCCRNTHTHRAVSLAC